MTLSPTHPDIVYARIGDRALTLDLYLPEIGTRPYPVILWLHGGAWRTGDKSWCGELLPLIEEGYAIASIDYRLSQEAIFPAQIRDVKAAARWLRQNAGVWGLDTERFAAGGSSAGGHLAALLGVSFYNTQWDEQRDYTECAPVEISSAVQAVVDWYGPSDFLHMNDTPGIQDHFAPDSPESQLIGGPVLENLDPAAAASPIRYIYPGFPSFLILHGDRDQLVLPNQSLLLRAALRKKGCHAEMALIEGSGHGFEGKQYLQALELSKNFLHRELRSVSQPRSFFYVCAEQSFRPRTRQAVRWLNPYEDFELARAYWAQTMQDTITTESWQEAHQNGCSYAAAFVDEQIVSLAAVHRFSDAAWDLSMISTKEEFRRQGYAKSVSSFVTKYILGAGKIATVCTRVENIAMQRAVESIGYMRV